MSTNKRMTKEAVAELITRRRRQILVHSCLYYRLNDNVIDDHTYDLWSKELAELQQQYPDIAAQCERHEDFKDFDGSSGFDLPIHEPDVLNSAYRLQRAVKAIKEKQQGGI
nr:hypothetical protein 32 [Bacillaceae bacterium]